MPQFGVALCGGALKSFFNPLFGIHLVKHETTKSSEEIIDIVKETCETQLPDYLRPFDYALIDELPKTSIGKIDYSALEKMAESQDKGE